MDSSPASTAPVRRRLAPRYSLRAMLIVLTLSCAAAAYWYRWPYALELSHGRKERFLWTESGGDVYLGREIQRFRRVLRGEPLREGMAEYFDQQGRRVGEDHWREDRLHGPCTHWYTTGRVQLRGGYYMGRQDGRWQRFGEDGKLFLDAEYRRDVPHGDWQWYDGGRVTRRIRFDSGEVTELDGQPVVDYLGKAIRSGTMDTPHEEKQIGRLHTFELPDAPLYHLQDVFIRQSQVVVALDPAARASPRTPTPLEVQFMPGNACWLVALSHTDLAATYRYGGIWITTRADAARDDPTGVEALFAQSRNTELEQVLDKPGTLSLVDAGLHQSLEGFGRAIGLAIEIRDKENDAAPMTISCQLPLRHSLGLVLDHFGMRVRRVERKLIVEPQTD